MQNALVVPHRVQLVLAKLLARLAPQITIYSKVAVLPAVLVTWCQMEHCVLFVRHNVVCATLLLFSVVCATLESIYTITAATLNALRLWLLVMIF